MTFVAFIFTGLVSMADVSGLAEVCFNGRITKEELRSDPDFLRHLSVLETLVAILGFSTHFSD